MSSARNLPCVFEEYSASTMRNQRWRHASASAAAKSLTKMAKYLPELSSLLDSLDNYSICERHYNQVIVKKSFMKQLTKLDDSRFSDSDEVERKRRKLTDNNDE